MAKKIVKRKILIADIKEVYAAMYSGMQIFCKDGSSWLTLVFKIDSLALRGTFTKADD